MRIPILKLTKIANDSGMKFVPYPSNSYHKTFSRIETFLKKRPEIKSIAADHCTFSFIPNSFVKYTYENQQNADLIIIPQKACFMGLGKDESEKAIERVKLKAQQAGDFKLNKEFPGLLLFIKE